MSTLSSFGRSSWRTWGCVVWCWIFSAAVAQAESPLAYVPKDADVIAMLNVVQIMDSDIFDELLKQYPDLKKMIHEPFGPKTKLTLEDIDRFMFMANVGEKQFVLAFRTTEDIEIGDIAEDYEDLDEETVGEEKLYVKDDEKGICVVDDRMFLMGTPATLRATLAKPGRYELADELDTVMEKLDPNAVQGAVAATLKQLVADNKAKLPPDGPVTAATVEKLEGAAFTLVAAEKLELALNLHCSDEAGAAQLKQLADVLLPAMAQQAEVPPVIKKLLTQLKTTAAGKKFSATVNLDVAAIADLVILAGKMEKAATVK